MDERFLPCPISFTDKGKKISDDWDSIILIEQTCDFKEINNYFDELTKMDNYFDKEVSCLKVPNINQKVIYSSVGEITDYDDVRCYFNAASKGLQRSISSGSKAPVLILPQSSKFENATLATILGALSILYVPIQYREYVPKSFQKVEKIGFYPSASFQESTGVYAKMVESGKNIARDIGGGDPERMTAAAVLSYVSEAFVKSSINLKSIIEPSIFKNEYPLFAAVNRCASTVQRHAGRIVFLEYRPPKTATKTLILVGKGVTYDTGGADIKAGGVMAGMSRDKCGAANVAGFMKLVDHLRPQDVIVIGVLCLVRNSCGSDAFVSDEVILSRAGVRIRIGNTDAEGRLCMADSLCQMKERCLSENLPNPHLYTVATLTGHACIAHGTYSIVVDNGPAMKERHGMKLKEIGDICGDPFEVSTLRKEDFDFNASTGYGEDLLQCNNLPSSKTPRGHQVPAAFLITATGLDKHGINSDHPLKYSHLDIAGSAGDVPDTPTGASILALAKMHFD